MLWGMRIVTTKRELRAALAACGARRVLVPTMGALHAGHASLLRQARELAGGGVVVASVFLNPTQFDNAGDLAAYPSTPGRDVALCEECGVDVLFMPEAGEMYRQDRSIAVEELALSRGLCGASRPGHFAGVCLVVSKLFNLVQPSDAIFGKKDYQQLAVLRRLVRDLDFPICIHGADIVREKDGLAISSRNVRLTPEHRAAAPAIYSSLLAARESFARGCAPAELQAVVRGKLGSIPGVRVDYVDVVDAETLSPLSAAAPGRRALLAVAAWFGEVRLIDNIEMTYSA